MDTYTPLERLHQQLRAVQAGQEPHPREPNDRGPDLRDAIHIGLISDHVKNGGSLDSLRGNESLIEWISLLSDDDLFYYLWLQRKQFDR